MKKSIRSFALFGSFFAVLVFCAAAAYAGEQYRTEISAMHMRSESSDDFRNIANGIAAEVFFSPVKTAGHPYAEAAFLERIGSASLAVLNNDVKFSTSTADGMTYLAGVNIVSPGSPLAVQVEYVSSNLDYSGSSTSYDYTAYDISLGNYFMNNLLAGIDYTKAEGEVSGSFNWSFDNTSYALFAKYVHSLSGGMAFNVEGSLGQSKYKDDDESLKNTDIDLSVDYYFTRMLSAGIGIQKSTGENDDDEGMTYTANVRYFITPRFSVKAGYERFLNGNAGFEDERTFDLALAARF